MLRPPAPRWLPPQASLAELWSAASDAHGSAHAASRGRSSSRRPHALGLERLDFDDFLAMLARIALRRLDGVVDAHEPAPARLARLFDVMQCSDGRRKVSLGSRHAAAMPMFVLNVA